MKYMILTFASQQQYQEMTGQPGAGAAWTQEDWAALGAFMREFSQELLDSGELVETRASPPRCTPGGSSSRRGSRW